MDIFKSFKEKVNNISSSDFEETAFELFKYQYNNNTVYSDYIKHLGISPASVKTVENIPFLPIEFFKSHNVTTGDWDPEIIFESSGTTGAQPSMHRIRDFDFYLQHSEEIFTKEFGQFSDYRFLALLPSYLEKGNSSLISMISHFIDRSGDGSGFFLNNYSDLLDNIQTDYGNTPVVWGVTYALLELAEQYPTDLHDVVIVETGGMKGRREEITRSEFYAILKKQLQVRNVFAEYGMTELLSQAYAFNEKFKCPESMRILIRDVNDPFQYLENGITGGLNIIDLANIHSCCFIETKDLGRKYNDGTFEVLGRFDNSDLRGCNLLI